MKNNNFINKNLGFTLVELIVTVTILLILGTVSFIGYFKYLATTRDTSRDTDMKNIETALNLYLTKNTFLPLPESYTTISASGTTIRYQGLLGKSIIESLDIGNSKQGSSVDPKTKEYYAYVIGRDKKDFQLVGYFEKLAYESPLISKANSFYDGAYFRTIGEDLGFLRDYDTDVPIHEIMSGSTLDIKNATGYYTVLFSNDDEIAGTGNVLFSNIYNRDKKLLKDKTLAILDNTLIMYLDMETTIFTGGYILMDDLGAYGNNGACFNGLSQVNCGTPGSGPQITNSNLKNGAYLTFDGIDDGVLINSGITLQDGFTYLSIVGANNSLNTSQNIFNNGQFFLRRQPYSESTFMPFESFVQIGGNVEPRAHSFIQPSSGSNYFLLSTWDKSKLNLYVNSTLKESQDRVGTLASNVLATIGRGQLTNTNTNFYNGTIDEVRIYNRALTDPEIQSIYESLK